MFKLSKQPYIFVPTLKLLTTRQMFWLENERLMGMTVYVFIENKFRMKNKLPTDLTYFVLGYEN